jgi:Tfp pilus assembly protein PilO
MEAQMEIKNRQQFLMILVGVALALLIGVDWVYTPLSDWWGKRAVEIRNLREKVSDGNQLIKRDLSVRNQWSEMQANALPANTSLAEQQVLKSFDSWSRNSGAELTGIMPQWKNDSTNYMTLTCRVEAGGSLGTLTRFLYEIENSPTPLRLDTVELGAHDNTGQQLTLGLEINGLALLPSTKP